MTTTGKHRRRIAWSIAGLALVAGLAVTAWRWKGRLKHELKEWTRTNSSRLAEAEAAYQKKDWHRAAELARPLMKAMGKDPNVQRIYARASARIERDGPAAAVYSGLFGSALMGPEDYFLLGMVLVRTGKPGAALEVWEKGAAQPPDHAELLDQLARLSVRMQQLDQAAKAASALSTPARLGGPWLSGARRRPGLDG